MIGSLLACSENLELARSQQQQQQQRRVGVDQGDRRTHLVATRRQRRVIRDEMHAHAASICCIDGYCYRQRNHAQTSNRQSK